MSSNHSDALGSVSSRFAIPVGLLVLCTVIHLATLGARAQDYAILPGWPVDPINLALPSIDDETVRVETQYDARGQVLRRSHPYYDGEGVRWSEYRYDSMDRQIQVTHPDGRSVSTRYLPGDVFSAVEVMDETGSKHVKHFDEFGNEVYRDRFDAGSKMRTVYGYDVMNRLIRISDPLGASWAHAYDGHGNRIASVDPDLGCLQMSYDAVNRLTAQASADGSQTTYGYDALDRVVSKMVDANALQFTDCSFVQQPPRATANGGYIVYLPQTISIPVADLLANDSDPNSDAISFVSAQSTGSGLVTLSEDRNTIYFTPYFSGDYELSADESYKFWPTSFAYTISDGQFNSTAAVEVEARWDHVNLTSLAIPDFGLVQTASNSVEFDPMELMTNDIDPKGNLSLVSVQDGINGTASISPDTGQIIFAPVLAPLEDRSRPEGQDYVSWPASFTYTATDGVTETSAMVEFEMQADPAEWLGYWRVIESRGYSLGYGMYSLAAEDLLQMHFPDTWQNLSIVSVRGADDNDLVVMSGGIITVWGGSTIVSGRLLTNNNLGGGGGVTKTLIYETSDGQTGTVRILIRTTWPYYDNGRS